MKEKAPFIHSGNSTKKIVLNYLLALIPLILYGFYKNGIFLYNKELILFSQIFKALYLPLIGGTIFVLIDYIFYLFDKQKSKKYSIFNTFYIIYGIILGMIVQPRISTLLFIILIIFSALLLKVLERFDKIKLNSVAVTKVLMSILLINFVSGSYQNVYESKLAHDYSMFDLFFGSGVGGISITNIFLVLIGFVILCTNKFYKKEIPIYFIIPFLLLNLLYSLITKDFVGLYERLMANGVLFSVIYIAPLLPFTPYLKKGNKLFGLLLLLLFLIINIFVQTDSIMVAIVITTLFTPLINKKYEQN